MSAVLKLPCSFILTDEKDGQLAQGEAEALLETETLTILPRLGVETIHLSLVDILEMETQDYRARLKLSSLETLSIYDLGYKFDDFVTDLSKARNEMILKYLLMDESAKKAGAVSGNLSLVDPAGSERLFENCGLKIYETSIVFIPGVAEPVRIHFSNIAQMEAKDYGITITTEQGQRLTYSNIGMEYEATVKDLSSAVNARTLQNQAIIKELAPFADPATIRNVARLMKDGRAAKRSDIESVSADVWSAIEKKIVQSSISSEYLHLKSIAQQDKISVGIKRGLMGNITGNYLWILVPIYGTNSTPGNAIALEAATLAAGSQDSNPTVGGEGDAQHDEEEGGAGGKATYFFRAMDRKDYPASNIEALNSSADSMISEINQFMLDINFRREPIMLSDEQLQEPKYARYRYAIQKIPSLAHLRKVFIGRVIHSSLDQWKSDVAELLKFNVLATQEDARWKKG
ncbi:MAG TPA: hypothetical protein VJP79_08145 [Nitrososphaera sp.]|nr:hypothetical protein [Nitrososphaera sp.]